MKLLFDENLSRKLVAKLGALFPGSTHVALEGLRGVSDRQVREFAKTQDFIVVTTDADFYELVTTYGPPPKGDLVAQLGMSHKRRRATTEKQRFTGFRICTGFRARLAHSDTMIFEP